MARIPIPGARRGRISVLKTSMAGLACAPDKLLPAMETGVVYAVLDKLFREVRATPLVVTLTLSVVRSVTQQGAAA